MGHATACISWSEENSRVDFLLPPLFLKIYFFFIHFIFHPQFSLPPLLPPHPCQLKLKLHLKLHTLIVGNQHPLSPIDRSARQKITLPFLCGSGICVLTLCSKHFYPLSHLAGLVPPSLFFFFSCLGVLSGLFSIMLNNTIITF